MTGRRERLLSKILWSLFGVTSIVALALLSWTLFRAPAPVALPSLAAAPALKVEKIAGDRGAEELAGKHMTRRAVERAPEAPRMAAGPAPIDALLRLKGVLDYGGKQPSLAVFELPGERKTKAFKAGDTIGRTGAVLKDVGETVVVEYDRRRWKLSYKGAQELPAKAVGDNR